MVSRFQRIPNQTVTCTVDACGQVATFAFTGSSDRRGRGEPIVAALCDQHAKDIAVRLRVPWPIPEP
jgi:hypothetical protein